MSKKREKKVTKESWLKRYLKKHKIGVTITATVVVGIFVVYVVNMKASTDLALWQIIQNFANPSIRYVKITEGMRQEEVADRFAKTLGWNDVQKEDLLKAHELAFAGKSEGYFYPQTYVVSVKADPKEVSDKIQSAFKQEVVDKTAKGKTNIINMDAIMKIASIIQREAGGKSDMKIISGIIWNRLFNGMTLDMDATLQYAKGTEDKWWPAVSSSDKYINSPYNTYKNKGLPPSPISNPGDAAIDAAMNPINTDALFYLHDKSGKIHTATTYDQQEANVAKYYP